MKTQRQAVRHAQAAPPKPSQAPAATQAPPTAKPGEKGPEQAAKPPKIAKVPWGKRDAEGELIEKLTTAGGIPADFDPKKNEPLKRKDFKSTADFLDYRADLAQKHVDAMRLEAKNERAGIGKATKGKQKRLVDLKSKYEQLMKELRDAGVDVDAAVAVAPTKA